MFLLNSEKLPQLESNTHGEYERPRFAPDTGIDNRDQLEISERNLRGHRVPIASDLYRVFFVQNRIEDWLFGKRTAVPS